MEDAGCFLSGKSPQSIKKTAAALFGTKERQTFHASLRTNLFYYYKYGGKGENGFGGEQATFTPDMNHIKTFPIALRRLDFIVVAFLLF